MLRAPARVGLTSGAQEAIGRVAQGFGWFGLGALVAAPAALALFVRTGRSTSDGHEPDVVLVVPGLEVAPRRRTSPTSSWSWFAPCCRRRKAR
ncbi:MAG TPA: hypothetical protein VJ827_06980 [Rubrobacter sp.]|nr:hypothetical protein [Rubrobacter sp.]